MSQYLKEDNASTHLSLNEAQQIRDQSKKEMQEYQHANTEELSDLEKQLHEMEKAMHEMENRQNQVKKEN